jgi:hypothetical protein
MPRRNIAVYGWTCRSCGRYATIYPPFSDIRCEKCRSEGRKIQSDPPIIDIVVFIVVIVFIVVMVIGIWSYVSQVTRPV